MSAERDRAEGDIREMARAVSRGRGMTIFEDVSWNEEMDGAASYMYLQISSMYLMM